MKKAVGISSSVTLRQNQITVDGKIVFEKQNISALDFLQAAYEHFQIGYPKFFKMDNLCKTGFITAELLLREQNLSAKYQPEEIGIICSSANSSLDTDIRYQESTATAPSPSLFVYTLPNVLIGELCIRHSVKGEAACFVFDIFDNTFQTEYVQSLFETRKIKACISGWADYFNGNAEAFFYLAETETTTGIKHNTESVSKLYNNLNT